MAATLFEADLRGAHLLEANLNGAQLNRGKLRKTNFYGANLECAKFTGADLREANLYGANLSSADLTRVDLREANLEHAILIHTTISKTNLTGCRVFGVSVWGVDLDCEVSQNNLRVTPTNEPNITVDNLELSQFVYLLLHNEKIRNVIDVVGQKGVLILGRFKEGRKAVLDAIRDKLRDLNYVPMMFDFEKPTQRDFTETIKTLAGMCRFIIADITNPKSSPLELQATVPDYMIPFIPIIQEEEEPFSMFLDLQHKYDWVLDVLRYDSTENLIKVFENAVVKPALERAEELVVKKAKEISEKHVRDYVER
jgi:hypothetical protein